MTYFGIGDASWIQGKIYSDAYLYAVKGLCSSIARFLGMDKATFIFQQDNARVHTARKVKEFFEQ